MRFTARRVVKIFGRTPVLKELDLTLEPGGCNVLFGRNGAGKSTLLRIAAMLLKPTSGEIAYDGRPLAEHGPSIRKDIGFVGHHSFLYGDLSVRENLAFYRELYGARRDIDELLEWSDLTLRASSPARNLSRGMQQRLAIARALLHEPRLLLLDEPFTGLDAISAERLRQLLNEIKRRETTLVLATHDIPRGVGLASRVLVMEAGRIAFDQTDASEADVRRMLFEAHAS